MSGETASGKEDGFALLETVIAFTILAIALGMAVETISQNARTFMRADDLETASLVLDELAADEMDKIEEAGETTGSKHGVGWHMSVTPMPDEHVLPLAMVTVTIWPRGESGPHFTYRTLRDIEP